MNNKLDKLLLNDNISQNDIEKLYGQSYMLLTNDFCEAIEDVVIMPSSFWFSYFDFLTEKMQKHVEYIREICNGDYSISNANNICDIGKKIMKFKRDFENIIIEDGVEHNPALLDKDKEFEIRTIVSSFEEELENWLLKHYSADVSKNIISGNRRFVDSNLTVEEFIKRGHCDEYFAFLFEKIKFENKRKMIKIDSDVNEYLQKTYVKRAFCELKMTREEIFYYYYLDPEYSVDDISELVLEILNDHSVFYYFIKSNLNNLVTEYVEYARNEIIKLCLLSVNATEDEKNDIKENLTKISKYYEKILDKYLEISGVDWDKVSDFKIELDKIKEEAENFINI